MLAMGAGVQVGASCQEHLWIHQHLLPEGKVVKTVPWSVQLEQLSHLGHTSGMLEERKASAEVTRVVDPPRVAAAPVLSGLVDASSRGGGMLWGGDVLWDGSSVALPVVAPQIYCRSRGGLPLLWPPPLVHLAGAGVAPGPLAD